MFLKLDGPLMFSISEGTDFGTCGSLVSLEKSDLLCPLCWQGKDVCRTGRTHVCNYVITQLDAQVEANYTEGQSGEKGFSLIVGWQEDHRNHGRKKPPSPKSKKWLVFWIGDPGRCDGEDSQPMMTLIGPSQHSDREKTPLHVS